MEIERLEIVPLTPERTDDYLNFFETALVDSGEWGHICYCVAYCGTDNHDEAYFEDQAVRRQAAIEYIRDGHLTGYLAYLDGQVVGWCNANDRAACLSCYGVREFFGENGAPAPDEKPGKVVFCFEVVPRLRGKHIATALLKRVLDDAARDGYAYVEAYPEKSESDPEHSYTGYKSFYEKMGFQCCGETQQYAIMRKAL